MTIPQALAAGLAGDKLSRALTGTDKVSAGRSAVATASSALLAGGVASTAVTVASTVGLTAAATVAAPLVIPVAVLAGAFGLIRSLWD